MISGSLFHSVVSPCTTLFGASPGIFALLGAAFVKIKLHTKYKGKRRRGFNLLLSIVTFLVAASDIGFSIHAWRTCDKAAQNTDIFADVGGLVAGLAVGYIVLNKYQESVGQAEMKGTGKFTDITPEDVRCCNIDNFHEAYLRNPDLWKLFRGQSTLLFT